MTRKAILAGATAGLVLLIALAASGVGRAHVLINESPSLPRGLYLRWGERIERGSIVAVGQPVEVRAYLARLPSRAGATFSGSVRYVGDGDGLCVGRSSDPATWIEVRLADFNAPELGSRAGQEARRRLIRLALDRPVACTAVRGRNGRVIVHDRVIARCRLNGRGLGDLLRADGGREGGR